MRQSLEFLLLLTFSSHLAWSQSVQIDVTLRPAGSFKATTNDIIGTATKTTDGIEAKNVKVPLKNLKTGISLRDTHARKYLEADKYPEAILRVAKGKDGKGVGLLKIKGIENKVIGTYEIKDNMVEADFPVQLSKYKITGIKYMGVGVDDEVQIHVQLPIGKAGTQSKAGL